MELVKVTTKDGKEIQVMPREVEGLKAAGLLKEEKAKTETKEEKETASTKLDGTNPDPKKAQEAKERMYPKSKRPVNISHENIKKG